MRYLMNRWFFTFSMPLTFNNHIKAYFSIKKYISLIQKRTTQIEYFLTKTSFDSIFKDYLCTNQLYQQQKIIFGTAWSL